MTDLKMAKEPEKGFELVIQVELHFEDFEALGAFCPVADMVISAVSFYDGSVDIWVKGYDHPVDNKKTKEE